MAKSTKKLNNFISEVKEKNPGEIEFIQAVTEVLEYVYPYIEAHHTEYLEEKILERLVEPDRIISFRVTWQDDKNVTQINRGYRIQMNSAIGPYKGGIRFHPSVNQSILKFLAFEQIFKNSLTSLPLGAGKGGADFNPRNKSNAEIMRFCQAYMNELYRHIGANTDVPAGDIGCGMREIGYMFGQYKKIKNQFDGIFTGKGTDWGGSYIRPEATGFGVLYFVENIFTHFEDSLKDKVVAISGAGNVAFYAAAKAVELGAKVITVSNSDGTLVDEEGFDEKKLHHLSTLGRNIDQYPKKYKNAKFLKDKKPWEQKCDIAIPCATQNELDKSDAEKLVKNGCICVAEGANMPCTEDAFKLLIKKKIHFAPGKAANAGGVSVSALEMSQNAKHTQWDSEEVDNRLKEIMKDIFDTCVKYGSEDGYINYLKGANIGGFIRIAKAMSAQGLV